MVKAQVFKKYHHDIWKQGEHIGRLQSCLRSAVLGLFRNGCLLGESIHYTPTERVWECWSYIGCEHGDFKTHKLASLSLMEVGRIWRPNMARLRDGLVIMTGSHFGIMFVLNTAQGNWHTQRKLWLRLQKECINRSCWVSMLRAFGITSYLKVYSGGPTQRT